MTQYSADFAGQSFIVQATDFRDAVRIAEQQVALILGRPPINGQIHILPIM